MTKGAKWFSAILRLLCALSVFAESNGTLIKLDFSEVNLIAADKSDFLSVERGSDYIFAFYDYHFAYGSVICLFHFQFILSYICSVTMEFRAN